MLYSNNAINNVTACSVLFLSTTRLFPARRKILEHETQSSALMFFYNVSAGSNPGMLKNSTEHTETFIAFRQFPQVNSIQLTTMFWTSRHGLQYQALAFGFDTCHSSAFGHLAC